MEQPLAPRVSKTRAPATLQASVFIPRESTKDPGYEVGASAHQLSYLSYLVTPDNLVFYTCSVLSCNLSFLSQYIHALPGNIVFLI